jgi:general secretion pathway protein G
MANPAPGTTSAPESIRKEEMTRRALDYASPGSGAILSKRARNLALILIIPASLAGIGILAVRHGFFVRSEKPKRTNSDLAGLETALNQFEIDCGRFPTTAEGLDALMIPPPGILQWSGPYVMNPPRDHRGHPFIYRCPGRISPQGYDLLSKGADGIEGTPDDITNYPDEL